jgi:hypothetical protein
MFLLIFFFMIEDLDLNPYLVLTDLGGPKTYPTDPDPQHCTLNQSITTESSYLFYVM